MHLFYENIILEFIKVDNSIEIYITRWLSRKERAFFFHAIVIFAIVVNMYAKMIKSGINVLLWFLILMNNLLVKNLGVFLSTIHDKCSSE